MGDVCVPGERVQHPHFFCSFPQCLTAVGVTFSGRSTSALAAAAISPPPPVTVNLCVVVVVDNVVNHVSSMQMSYTARCCSLCSLAAVATSPSMNVYSSVTVDFSAYISSRSEHRCFVVALVRVVTSCLHIFWEKNTDVHSEHHS